METLHVGRHVIRYLPTDLIYLVFDGDVTKEEARQISIFFSERIDGRDGRYVVDLRRLGTMPPDARRELGVQRLPPRTDRDYRADLMFVGATMRTKLLMTVVIAAATIASNMTIHSHYVPALEEAIAWTRCDPAAFGVADVPVAGGRGR
jgi:hypothetical protein